MSKRIKHLKTVREFLGYEGNPAIHRLLDITPIQYHKLTHNPAYIEAVIRPEFGLKGEIEAWLHLLEDWGIYN